MMDHHMPDDAGLASGWSGHGLALRNPVGRARGSVRVLRQALAGERVKYRSAELDIDGFRLARPPARPPLLLVAARRSRDLGACRVTPAGGQR